MLKELKDAVRGEVISDKETLEDFSEDASIFHITPSYVVRPKDAQDVQSLVSFAKRNKGISLTARSAGTDMTGGPLSDSIVVDFLPNFNKVLEVGDGWAKTQPGVFYRNFEKKTLAKNWLLPCYTASRELNTVGGMVANNSGGEKSLVYGKTEKYVRSLKMVLSDGKEYSFQKLSRKELEAILREDSFLGDIYRKTENLIKENHDVIQKARPNVSKNSAGYALWSVWDKEEDTFDLTKLLLGLKEH
ncbi:MAG: FAD-binding oxidoreductase [Candidatus Pacebacteria bacterium]|nr:FAD-binding oxidoreductase [Candidatus Paceibacterota bacterium]